MNLELALATRIRTQSRLAVPEVGLGDVAGVFSRYFVVGFVLPVFFALVVLSQSLTGDFLPGAYQDLVGGTRIAVLGGAAALGGLLLLGFNHPLLRLVEGYPLAARREGKILGHIHELAVGRQRKRFDALSAVRDSDGASNRARGRAAWQLDRQFSDDRDGLLPTLFGNSVRAFERHSKVRWGLDSIAAWPRIELLLSDTELETHADAKSDVAFFLNSGVLSFALGGILAADGIANRPVGLELAWLYLAPFIAAYLLYGGAVGAAARWGSEVRSIIDIHRLELYERLGVRAPRSFSDERDTIAPAVSRCLLYGTSLADDLRAGPETTKKEEKDDE